MFVAFTHTVKRKEFQRRRKAHYNEFEAVRRARLLMAEEDDDEDDDDDNHKGGDAKIKSSADNNNPMDVDSDCRPPPSASSTPDAEDAPGAAVSKI